ncbi:response regulator [Nonomuraea sp. NPDC050556]|uniref:response regulator n=1 Tax=Nonomuraea sp. NPDC050556 TaxID=3364369 RepID=UPI003787ED3E
MIKVLLADDQMLIRVGLAALIRATPDLDLVGEAESGEDAVELARTARPDVILMDIRMPGLDGLAATEEIIASSAGEPPRILILTTFDIDEYVYQALRAGASGFLLKETAPERLMAAIRTVATGDVLLSPSSTRRLIESFHRPQAPTPNPALDRLTPRETQVLPLVGRALSNGEIARQLHLSEATVKSHLNHAMSKLGLSSRVQVVTLAYDAGLVAPGWTR